MKRTEEFNQLEWDKIRWKLISKYGFKETPKRGGPAGWKKTKEKELKTSYPEHCYEIKA